MIRKRAKRLAGAVLAAGAITAMPFQAFAQRSPEFAYSAEKWATLRDNKLEFDEISDLVHEYNPTVVQNEISYKDYLTKNRDDVARIITIRPMRSIRISATRTQTMPTTEVVWQRHCVMNSRPKA